MICYLYCNLIVFDEYIIDLVMYSYLIIIYFDKFVKIKFNGSCPNIEK